MEEKKETEAQSCLDRIWYSLNCSARFDRVIIANPYLSLESTSFVSLSRNVSEVVNKEDDRGRQRETQTNRKKERQNRAREKMKRFRFGFVLLLRGPSLTVTFFPLLFNFLIYSKGPPASARPATGLLTRVQNFTLTKKTSRCCWPWAWWWIKPMNL